MSGRHRISRPLIFSVVQLVLVGLVDHLTGERLDFFLFYFIPIGYLAWHVGRRAAIIMAAASGTIWWLVNMLWVQTGDSWAVDAWNEVVLLASFLVVACLISGIRAEVEHHKKTAKDLSEALSTIRRLTGIVPMCVYCRRIRDKKDEWLPLESYIARHTEAQVSHGMCPQCYRQHHGDPDGT